MRRSIIRILAALAICFLLPPLFFGQAAKKKITRAADVPQFQYSVNGRVEDLLKSEDAFRPFAAQVRRDVESILREYQFEDSAAKRRLLNVVAALDLLDGHDQAARQRLMEVKALEEKPAARLLSGLERSAVLEARTHTRDRNAPAYRQAIYDSVKHSLEGLPFDVVQNDVKTMKARRQIASEAMIVGQIRAIFDPVVVKTGALSSDMAFSLPEIRLNLVETIPLKNTFNEAFGAYLSAHAKDKTDIWAERDVTLEMNQKHQLVHVAVWDSGVDLAIFRDRVAKDASGESAVLAYDIEWRKTIGNLYPLNPEQMSRFPEAVKHLKGFSDLRANIESSEVNALRQWLSKIKPEEVRPFMEEISFYGAYSHGTYVAGILTAGNPYARLVTGRLTLDWKMIPNPCPSRARADRAVAAAQDYVNFFKKHDVRVVNMSWGYSVKVLEDALEKCGVERDLDIRKKTAREWFEMEKYGLQKALLSAPDILFVAAAGNSNTDATFDEAIPASLRIPNLLTVAAVDKAGDEAAFTSYGPTVVVAANGFEVESYIPGGSRLRMSGTSAASPNAANLAAKIIVVNPKLKPAEVIDIIRKTAEKTADGRRNLIHPKKAVAAAAAEM